MLLAIHCPKSSLLRAPQKPAVIKPIAISVVELRDLNHLLSTVISSGCPTAVFIVVKIPLNCSTLLEISNITLSDVSISHPWMTRMWTLFKTLSGWGNLSGNQDCATLNYCIENRNYCTDSSNFFCRKKSTIVSSLTCKAASDHNLL